MMNNSINHPINLSKKLIVLFTVFTTFGFIGMGYTNESHPVEKEFIFSYIHDGKAESFKSHGIDVIEAEWPAYRHDPDPENLNAGLREIVSRHGLIGLSVTVIANHEIVYEGIFGKAVHDPEKYLTRNSIFRIASITKTTVTMGAMRLMERGLLDLDEDVSNYLGWELRNPNLPDEVITLRHLLGHTSGIRDGEGYPRFISEMIDQQLNIRELFQPDGSHYTDDMFSDYKPGVYFSYSNSTWSLVATVIENLSGMRFDRYMNEELFAPLNMNASFNVTDFDGDEFATLYRMRDDEWVPQVDYYVESAPIERAYENYRPGHNGLLYGPQGNLRIDTESLQILALTLMNGGKWNGVRVLEASTIDLMSTPNWIYNGSNGVTWEDFWLSYGLGVHQITNQEGKDVIFPDRTLWGHPGIAYGLLSNMYIDPETGSGILFITNGSQYPFQSSENSSFYTVEEEVFKWVYPFLRKMEKGSE